MQLPEPHGPEPLQLAGTFWLRNKRRLVEPLSIIERRRFNTLRREFYDSLWHDAARAISAQAQSLPDGSIRITRAGSTRCVHQSDLMLDSETTVATMFDKALTYRLMASKGMRIPRQCHYRLATIDQAEAFMAECSGPVVVKPAQGTGGGRGVVTCITNRAALHAASRHAAGFQSSRLLVEEQLNGCSLRLLYLDGEFIDAVRRDPPIVVGDGKSTIRQLVSHENWLRRTSRPLRALSPLIIDQESRNTLALQGKCPGFVPAAGETVRVKLAVNENASGQNHVVRDRVHEELVLTGSSLVRELGIRFAGLDVTIDDIAASIDEGGAIFNEINVNPGIYHHYFVANPEAGADVAHRILERVFATSREPIAMR